MCFPFVTVNTTESLPKRESVWRRGRSSWSFEGSNKLRESSPDTWNGSAKPVGSIPQPVLMIQSPPPNNEKVTFVPLAEEVLLEEEEEIAEEKSPLDGAWYKRKQNLPGDSSTTKKKSQQLAFTPKLQGTFRFWDRKKKFGTFCLAFRPQPRVTVL